jgi:hypothetical protein
LTEEIREHCPRKLEVRLYFPAAEHAPFPGRVDIAKTSPLGPHADVTGRTLWGVGGMGLAFSPLGRIQPATERLCPVGAGNACIIERDRQVRSSPLISLITSEIGTPYRVRTHDFGTVCGDAADVFAPPRLTITV